MAWRSGLSRSLISTARVSLRQKAPPPLPRVRPLLPSSGTQSRSFSLFNSRNLGVLGCTESLLPLHSITAATRLISQLGVSARDYCELSHGTFCRTCQDR